MSKDDLDAPSRVYIYYSNPFNSNLSGTENLIEFYLLIVSTKEYIEVYSLQLG